MITDNSIQLDIEKEWSWDPAVSANHLAVTVKNGVATLNGVVLLSAARRLEDEGLSSLDAARRAAHERLRPVLTTAVVASLGFLPMALATGTGSEVQRPLATVVIGGLVTATALTLLLLPSLFARARRFRASKTEPEVAPPT